MQDWCELLISVQEATQECCLYLLSYVCLRLTFPSQSADGSSWEGEANWDWYNLYFQRWRASQALDHYSTVRSWWPTRGASNPLLNYYALNKHTDLYPCVCFVISSDGEHYKLDLVALFYKPFFTLPGRANWSERVVSLFNLQLSVSKAGTTSVKLSASQSAKKMSG